MVLELPSGYAGKAGRPSYWVPLWSTGPLWMRVRRGMWMWVVVLVLVVFALHRFAFSGTWKWGSRDDIYIYMLQYEEIKIR